MTIKQGNGLLIMSYIVLMMLITVLLMHHTELHLSDSLSAWLAYPLYLTFTIAFYALYGKIGVKRKGGDAYHDEAIFMNRSYFENELQACPIKCQSADSVIEELLQDEHLDAEGCWLYLALEGNPEDVTCSFSFRYDFERGKCLITFEDMILRSNS